MPPTFLDVVTDCFLEATTKISPIYFQLPVMGIEVPKFLERVYCYELYHQMRMLWPNVPYQLTGEVDKSGHPRIRQGVLNRSKPDFTIHVPGNMDANLLVIEVKARDPVDQNVVRDLEKLTAFCISAGYDAAYYLIYGFSSNEVSRFAARCVQLARTNAATVDLAKITLFNQTSPMTKASKIAWPS
ncbi:MAG: methionyl-tRNA formyltransferase-like protein [Verrucomicrobiales bacterium]|nr:methionyl-tRNA formyltransferase-like protein [Verrucomicrobiales bacterium]